MKHRVTPQTKHTISVLMYCLSLPIVSILSKLLVLFVMSPYISYIRAALPFYRLRERVTIVR
jgi:hypothetical protein